MSVINLFKVAFHWQTTMCRMSYKKAGVCCHPDLDHFPRVFG